MPASIDEYIQALCATARFRGQIAHHRLEPPAAAAFQAVAKPWPGPLRQILSSDGLADLYSHQAVAIDRVRSGRHTVVATPTASGKTLTYNLPFLEQCLREPRSRALYLFPLKALAQDQLGTFLRLAGGIASAAIYDGDTTAYQRRKIRLAPPNALLTNPEMLHLAMLPHHSIWADFFANLTHIVVDEVHTYRGVMGSNMAMVFRRLRRICAHYGANPTFVFCSATVGNPAELCANLTGLDVGAVTASGAAQGPRHMVFINPTQSPAQATIQLLQAALARGLRTIVYAQSRRYTELLAMWASTRAGRFRDRISAYRAGFLPEERRQVEQRMASGELLAVISTSALELGIDIGGLDLCLLLGYPGTVMATRQRGGRVGRSQRSSAVVLVAQEDAMDQYFMRHPEDFFERQPEPAIVNAYNPIITATHLECAAAEWPLRPGDPLYADPAIAAVIQAMLAAGKLLQVDDSAELVGRRKRPHRDVDLRSAGHTVSIEDLDSGDCIGTVDSMRARSETHPGAVYLHRGHTYLIEALDLEHQRAAARRATLPYYTKARSSKDTTILETFAQKQVYGAQLSLGRLRVTETITGYEKRRVRGGQSLGIVPLDMPPLVYETDGLWLEIPSAVALGAEQRQLHVMGGIHAIEHAAIGITPLLILTDRNDLGGISIPRHPQLQHPAVFLYSGVPGGAGLSQQAFAQAETLLTSTYRAVSECPCELGCPSCVHSPKCGSGNRPIDKAAAVFMLGELLAGSATTASSPAPTAALPAHDQTGTVARPAAAPLLPSSFVVLDIETRRAAAEVGGWQRADRMGISVAIIYDSKQDRYYRYSEAEVPQLMAKLQAAELIIGFNIVRFDYAVLSGLTRFDFSRLPTLDLLTHLHNRLGFRLKLDNLGASTLDAPKSADGLQALQWWKQGNIEAIATYCQQDVTITRDLYLFGCQHGYVLFTNKDGKRVRAPVQWRQHQAKKKLEKPPEGDFSNSSPSEFILASGRTTRPSSRE